MGSAIKSDIEKNALSAILPLVLIVDDNHDNINVIEEMLEQYGFEYYAVSDPLTIQDVLEYRKPDLILLDLYMPQQSGLETLTIIKNDNRFESIPVLMLTAETDKRMLSRCLDTGAMDYINKPVDAVELQARIRSALKISSLTKDLSERNDELDRKNKEIQKFTATIVHDLKNPLTVIMASIDFVRNTLVETKQTLPVQFADMIKETTFSMRDSINEMLDVSRIQQGAFKLNMVKASPVDYIEKCLFRLRLLGNKKSITIVHEKREVPHVYYDEKCINSIIMNLVGNSIKYSNPNSEIRLSYEVHADYVRVLVKDQGQGMTEKDLSLVFKEFQRLSARPTDGESSTGLGLAIVKSVAEAMDASVGVSSEGRDKGSTFWFGLRKD
ncbi:hybrid sensor histidine kinase/response regulator [bacterium]|nr:MAG: hybrid sensor histidine kinase/response regulator [bacterium]